MTEPAIDGSERKGVGGSTYAITQRTCAEISPVPLLFRQEIAKGPAERANHERIAAGAEALWNIELSQPSNPAQLGGSTKVTFWNLERCRYVEASADMLAAENADINLLCELDLGMARTAQRNTSRDLANILKQGYAFGVEFIELGLGDPDERARHIGEENEFGLHGNAILSRTGLIRPVLIRLFSDGRWFDGQFGERRLGGRIAIAATILIAGQEVALVCTHFESRGDPTSRKTEMEELLAAVGEYAGDNPVLIAGDLNTSSTDRENVYNDEVRTRLQEEDPNRYVDPVAYEPLFEIAAAAGFDWKMCNSPDATQRKHTPPVFERRLDWFFTRGLKAWNPTTISATNSEGEVLSDHDAISVMIGPEVIS